MLKRPLRLSVRTPGFHPGKRSSILLGAAINWSIPIDITELEGTLLGTFSRCAHTHINLFSGVEESGLSRCIWDAKHGGSNPPSATTLVRIRFPRH